MHNSLQVLIPKHQMQRTQVRRLSTFKHYVALYSSATFLHIMLVYMNFTLSLLCIVHMRPTTVRQCNYMVPASII